MNTLTKGSQNIERNGKNNIIRTTAVEQMPINPLTSKERKGTLFKCLVVLALER